VVARIRARCIVPLQLLVAGLPDAAAPLFFVSVADKGLTDLLRALEFQGCGVSVSIDLLELRRRSSSEG
jgi:hypothetical protein